MHIQIHQLKKIYGEKTAVNIPELAIRQGELVGLVGNNGAGKTTLMRLILDLIRADEGNVHIDETDVSLTEAWKAKVGSFIDSRFLIDFYTPEEYFGFIAKVYNIRKTDLETRLAEFSPIDNGEILGTKKYISNFSQGNQQKIGIIGAMITHPDILILDEPFNYLDPSSQIFVAKKIQQLCHEQGTTVLISSHNIQFIADISTRILLMEKGEIKKDIQAGQGDMLTELNQYFEQE